MCENLKKKYEEKNIPEDIFYDTVEDLVTWTNTWSDIKDGLYLGELGWLANHLKMKLFRLGRLQFCMGVNKHDIPEEELKKGDNIIEVHIPEGAPLTYEECEKSFERAKEFFNEFYPDFDYKCFTCHSWLMDDTLDELLSENSNMIKFKNMFRRYHREEDFAILRYVFKWNTKKSNVRHAVVSSSFAEKVKKHTLSGKSFYCAYGVRSK